MSLLQTFSNSPAKDSGMIGTDVVNPKGDDPGDVEEVVVDPRTGRVAYAVVSFGGFLDMEQESPVTGDFSCLVSASVQSAAPDWRTLTQWNSSSRGDSRPKAKRMLPRH
ncbi:MAG: PRC-barrel domain-containing protein [Betaproteobacteria bacterium]